MNIPQPAAARSIHQGDGNSIPPLSGASLPMVWTPPATPSTDAIGWALDFAEVADVLVPRIVARIDELAP